MTISYEEFIVQAGLDEQALEEGMRSYVFERAGYLPADQMRNVLVEICGEDELNEAVTELENNAEARAALTTTLLAAAWESSSEADRIRSATAHTKEKLEIFTLSIIVTALLYGLWLQKTGGVKSVTERKTVKPDGTQTTEKTQVNYSFANPLKEVFRKIGLR